MVPTPPCTPPCTQGLKANLQAPNALPPNNQDKPAYASEFTVSFSSHLCKQAAELPH